MALPREYPTSKVLEVQEKISKMSAAQLGALPSLAREDHETFGQLIQDYCFIDLNLRRALEIFKLAKILPGHAFKKYPDFNDSQLVGLVKEVIEAMDPSAEDVPSASQKLKEIEYGRRVRNLVGHFAAKRFPGEEVFVFASKNEQDAKRTLGRLLRDHHAQTAVAGRLEIIALKNRISGHSNWLAHRIPIWDKRYLDQ